MADLTVDYDQLDNTSQALGLIAAEFERMHDHRLGLEGIWGSPRMRKAMDSFADNWKVHRAKLTEDIRTLGGQCTGVADTFRQVDCALSGVPADHGTRSAE